MFDRDAIIRAALRAYVEALVKGSPDRGLPLSFVACEYPRWTGDLERGAFDNGDLEGNNEVVAWTEAGVVGLGYELGWGPIEYLNLAVDAVTGGPDDVRGALPGLPDALEPTLVIATNMLEEGNHGEKLAGVGFWLCGDLVDGTLFSDPTAPGAKRLTMWGLLRRGRLLPPIYCSSRPDDIAALAGCDRREAPIHAIMDAVVDRRMRGPTELTTDELAALLPPAQPGAVAFHPTDASKVGIAWPGSPELPPMPPPGLNPFTGKPFTEAELARSRL
ncbi:MAG: hypothetical protein IPM54_38590 [Polyangiaceae bacterium]|nr:hypothetical protein [Polyangiaceae bacterium]